MKLVRWAVVLSCLSTVALAQEPRPSVAPFTLDLKRAPSGFSKKDREDLQRVFPLLLRAAGALVPDAARMTSSIAELKRQDCDREDQCLTQLAKLAGTLYAVHVSLDYTLEKHVVVVGRVVRDDGQVSRAQQTVDIVKEGAFRDVARDGVNQLLAKLDIGRLPSVREVEVKKDPEPVVVKKDPEPVRLDPVLPPPPPPVVDVGAGQRDAGKLLIIGGAVVAGVGGVLSVVGAGVAGGQVTGQAPNKVIKSGGVGTFTTGQTLTTAGLVTVGVGAIGAAVGGVVLALAPAAPVSSVSVVPVNGGGVVQFGGSF